MRSEFSAVPFEDMHKAEANLARLEQQLAPSLLAPLASLLSHSPDPDSALNLLERYAEAAPPEVLGDLARHPAALSYLIAIFSYSSFLAETFLAEPDLPVQFARDRKFTKLKSKEDLMQDLARMATTAPDVWLSAQLARFKRRNYLRIVLKDVLGMATLGETTLEISALADVILTHALQYCDRELEKRYGQPQYRDAQGRIVRSGFSVVSLGKLGGTELNYSSDIDLLFLYSHDGETAGGSEQESIITNKEYFVRLAHALTRTITQPTPQGEVFRVDLRLRPEGEQGDLAISLKSSLDYYEHRARDWELQMLIKARHSAGDLRLTREFLRSVEPFIYRSPGDFEVVESVLLSREQISKKMRESHKQAVDIKRHRGGIRDIEFLAQCLQRLHGRQDPWVRSGGTLLALRKLNDKGWVSNHDYARLTNAYELLRKVEHRVQLDLGRQTHRLPAQPEALDRLARRVGVETKPNEIPGNSLHRQVREAFDRVDEIYQQVVHPRGVSGTTYELKSLPTSVPDLAAFSFDSTLAFLDAQGPELAAVLRHMALPERARRNATKLFAALLASSERFAFARQNPERIQRALEILASSEFLGELLIRHPEELAIFDPQEAGPEASPGGTPMLIGIEVPATLDVYPWAREPGLGTREKMALLRREYRSRILKLGAADIAGLNSIFAALGRWSTAAGKSIASALCIAREALSQNLPPSNASDAELPLVVLGLGRLGLREFDLASDADLLFVVDPEAEREEMASWTRLAEKTIEVLSSYTRDGTIFAVDTRLRPRGQEGDLVVTREGLLNYVRQSAQTWEALTYLKACPVAGDLERARGVAASLVHSVLERFSTHPALEEDLHQMRRRLERERNVPPSNTKTAPGGYYDVDFAVSYLRLRHSVATPAGSNISEQIAALEGAGLMSQTDAAPLEEGARFLRSVDHAARLVTGKAASGLPEHVGHAESIEHLARRWGLIKSGESLNHRLRQMQDQVRYIYRRLVGSE